jgi:hypothetical protein
MAISTINIGASPDIRGSLKFAGANLIGPQLTVTLTLVQFAPAAVMNLIGDEWGLIELEGEVLLVSGNFGTVSHPDDTLVSPNILAYYVGTGIISWQPHGGTGYTVLGNCQQFEFEPQITRLDHWEHMTGVRSKDFAPIVQQAARCRLRLDEFTAYNLKMFMMDGGTVGGP